jgi:hypothetical protein
MCSNQDRNLVWPWIDEIQPDPSVGLFSRAG